MTSGDPALDDLLARYIEHDVLHGRAPSLEELCRERPDLIEPLREQVRRYRRLEDTLSAGAGWGLEAGEVRHEDAPLPSFEGLQTIERLGRGGMGEVYKVKDLRLGRILAAKVLRATGMLPARYGSFLREARAMALFQDPRIVQIHEFRPDADPPVILMEYVEGFDLARVAPSLEYRQRARILLEVCEAVQHAHDLGIQHRDLKPANILLDERLSPKIVDFGLSGGDPVRGHLLGTLPYLAPEQLDPRKSIDARTDVYALGIILYEILCGERPYDAESTEATISALERADPRLPVEIDPAVPEPLQAIALRAMERDPARRYASAREMARDLRRYLDDRPVLARPTLYGSILGRRVLPHLEQIEEWLQLRLIYPHEASRLREVYRHLESRDEDWIVQSRVLSYSQIALYLGAFLLLCGALLYFGAHRFFGAVRGVVKPFFVLGLPFLGLNAGAHVLYRKDHKAVAVAFYLGGVLLLPLFLLILLHETGLWSAAAGAAGQLFDEATVSNHQLQVAVGLTFAWSCWLALRTRTVGLSSVSTFVLGLLALAVLADFGLRGWLEDGRWDLLALHLTPVLVLDAVLAAGLERSGRAWFGRPLWVGAAVLFVVVLELLSLDGRAFSYLGLSLARLQVAELADPVLLDTLAAMAIAGVLFYVAGSLMDRRGTPAMRAAVWLMVVISPFATLEPVAYLVQTGDYSRRYDWLYLVMALGIAVLSHHRQRKSFYLAGLLNTGAALWMITDHNEWFDRPLWAVTVIVCGLGVLVTGLMLAVRERSRRQIRS